MTDYRHILVATDLSEEARQVGEQAVDLARRFDAKVCLMHVCEKEDAVREAKDFLGRLAERLGVGDAQIQAPVSSKTRDEILRVVKEQNADLIVVGTHGRHGLALLRGSTANAILHGTTCDVLAVRLAA